MKIKFKRDTAFRKQFFVPDSFAHPAKMDAQLLIWIVEHYSEVGETILDPMAGSGTTMLACILGRDVVLVELEEKFCKMMRDNWEQVKMRPQLGSTMGSCQIIQGDARQLEGLLGLGNGFNYPETEPLGRTPAPATQVDKIVTSPPFADTNPFRTDDIEARVEKQYQAELKATKEGRKFGIHSREAIRQQYEGQMTSPDNIQNLPYGEIDKCIFSPPYADISHPTGDSEKQRDIMAQKHHWAGTEYSDNQDNIGNLKSQSYLEAMLQVYQQCYKVLRDKGLMILVTRNFIRNKQVVRLDEDTIKLCEQAGFSFVERHYRELPSQSFWRVIYHKKFPDVEQIKSEDVLIFRK